MNAELWLVFFVSAVALSLTPGPNGLLCLNHGARYGLGRSVFTSLGSITGITALVGASFAGLGAVMVTSELLFSIVKWVGAAYLVWLGVRLWRAPGFETGITNAGSEGAQRSTISRRRAFSLGLTVALSNPKALIFFATFLPQFMRSDVSLWLQFAVFAGTFAVVEFAYEVCIAGVAYRLAPTLERFGRAFNRITGATFIGVGTLVAASER